MAYQKDTVSGYRDLVNKIVAFATSKHVSAVAVNAGGSGYILGEMLTVTHAGAAMDCTAEVTGVSGTAVTAVKLRNMGAFSNRVSGAPTVNAGGSGYAVGDVLEIEGGTSTQKAKVKVATLSGSAVATVTAQDGGGAYSVAPGLTGASTNNNPGSGSGTGCTLDLTMTGLIGTTGIATTSDGSGTGCTLNLTLTDSGWTADRDWNNYTYNSVTDEREVVLQGTVAAGDEPYVGIRSYTETEGVDDRWGLVLCGMTAYSAGDDLGIQMNVGPAAVPSTDDAAHLVCLNSSQDVWFAVTGRRITGAVKCQGASILAYQPFWLGLGSPYGTATENPFPMFIAGTTAVRNKAPDVGTDDVTSFLECIAPNGSISTPVWFYRLTDTSWIEVSHYNNVATLRDHTIYPVGETEPLDVSSNPNFVVRDGAFTFTDGICDPQGGAATRLLYPSPDSTNDISQLVPLTLIRSPSDAENSANDDVHLELDGWFWVSATKDDGTAMTAEDTITVGSDRYQLIPSVHNTNRYSYMALKEA